MQVQSDNNINFSSDVNDYGKFHVIAIAVIVLIFLLRLSSSSIPAKPNHEGLSTHVNTSIESVNTTLAVQK